MRIKGDSDHRIFIDAARWISDFHEGRADRSALFAWLAESPRHVEEMTLCLALNRAIATLSQAQREDIEAMAAEVSAPSSASGATLPTNVVSLHESEGFDHGQASSLSPRRKWIERSARLAAALAVISLMAWSVIDGPFSGQRYTTGIGEQRTVELEDGSLVHLNTHSELRVHLRRSARMLELKSGEALFKVRHDAARPFLVDAGDSVIRAVGTQFDVYRRSQGTLVAVLEGTVQVTPQTKPLAGTQTGAAYSSEVSLASAGETVDVSARGVVKRRQASTADVTAWRQHRLVFRDDTLLDIATEFNRYNKAPQIQVEGEFAQQHRFAGTFDADAPDALLSALRSDETLIIERDEARIVIRGR